MSPPRRTRKLSAKTALILTFVEEHPGCTTREVKDGLELDTATDILRGLHARNLVASTVSFLDPHRRPHWWSTAEGVDALAYQEAKLAEIASKFASHEIVACLVENCGAEVEYAGRCGYHAASVARQSAKPTSRPRL